MKISVYAIPGIVTNKEHTVDSIIDGVCDYFGITRQEMFLPTRKREVIYKRQVAIYFCFLLLKKPYISSSINSSTYIGKKFGKDHATVLHAKKTIKNLSDTDNTINMELFAIKEKLNR